MAEFFHAQSRQELGDLLTSFAHSKPADTSFALTFVGGALPTAEVTAIKEAVKICDVVIAVWLPALARPMKGQKEITPPGESYHAALQKLGVDVFAVLPDNAAACTVTMHDKALTLDKTPTATTILQAMTTVLPNVLIIPRAHTKILLTSRKLLNTFGPLTAIRSI